MPNYYLAMYIGEGDWKDKLVRKVTRSKYSHCEIKASHSGLGITSSLRNGGVRMKYIEFEKNWELIPIHFYVPDNIADKARPHKGKRYDIINMFFTKFFKYPYPFEDSNRYTCSEFCGYLLGIQQPYDYSPEQLMNKVIELNESTPEKYN